MIVAGLELKVKVIGQVQWLGVIILTDDCSKIVYFYCYVIALQLEFHWNSFP